MNAKKQKIIGYVGLMFVGVYAVALGLSYLHVRIKDISSQCLISLKDRENRQVERRYWDV
jgi:hypothetical protein